MPGNKGKTSKGTLVTPQRSRSRGVQVPFGQETKKYTRLRINTAFRACSKKSPHGKKKKEEKAAGRTSTLPAEATRKEKRKRAKVAADLQDKRARRSTEKLGVKRGGKNRPYRTRRRSECVDRNKPIYLEIGGIWVRSTKRQEKGFSERFTSIRDRKALAERRRRKR